MADATAVLWCVTAGAAVLLLWVAFPDQFERFWLWFFLGRR